MKLFRTQAGAVVERERHFFSLHDIAWDALVSRADVRTHLEALIDDGKLAPTAAPTSVLAPVQSQEVWAAGVTYLRSREARMEESKSAGGGDFYDRVYAAQRPELFFKSAGHRVVASGGKVRIRRDSKWNVPEPELTLLIAASGKITGYTIGNDMSSRDIEGENPLYLPQAKVYDGACAMGPGILLSETPLPPQTRIEIGISRGGQNVFSGTTEISRIKRRLDSLAEFLFRETTFPHGCFLLTGTGVVPGEDFTLHSGDQISITIEPIGTLTNTVE
jgi:2-dehydro-3-deoxy-D-arabinonate dehydratase